jgi:hypothetical protein
MNQSVDRGTDKCEVLVKQDRNVGRNCINPTLLTTNTNKHLFFSNAIYTCIFQILFPVLVKIGQIKWATQHFKHQSKPVFRNLLERE